LSNFFTKLMKAEQSAKKHAYERNFKMDSQVEIAIEEISKSILAHKEKILAKPDHTPDTLKVFKNK